MPWSWRKRLQTSWGGSYLFDRYTHTSRLALLSPVDGCGKTTLLRFLELLVRNVTSSANATPAVIYHELARNPHLTWLIDEADNLDLLRHANGVMRSVLNMGHAHGASVRRMVQGEPRKFNVFCGERSLHTGEVVGSIPTAPTSI
ncbi:MAG: hypothetical protein WAK55_01545 [Xanthobacteraceae bacterium]